ncbi:MAG TPA: DUF4907 domain-containing protein [Hanamia sp.]|nr:DUF4907 domain-containing protein [Hanamia sp.]
MKKKLFTIVFFIITITVIGACKSNTSDGDIAAMTQKGMVPVEGYTFKTENGWGYTITVNNKVFIKQTLIPAIEGNRGFSTQEDAAKVAQLIIDKLANHKSPAVKKEDLEKLGIIK